MVWSCFYGKTRGPLVAHLEKSVNANVYLRMLHRYLFLIVYKIHDTIGDPLFQQDNAPIHKAGRYEVLREPQHQLSYPPSVFTRPQSHRALVGSVEATAPYRLARYRRYPRRAPRSKGALSSSPTETHGNTSRRSENQCLPA